MASLTIPEMKKEKKKVENKISSLIKEFEKLAEISVDYINYDRYDYSKDKRRKLKTSKISIKIDIDNDTRSL